MWQGGGIRAWAGSRARVRLHQSSSAPPLGDGCDRNGTNGFNFFGKGGEVATNRLEDQEVSVLSLHLLQIALVYVNTLMIQNVLGEEDWMSRMAAEDFRALTPLIHSHINPYGSFELDMEKRLPLDEAVGVAV